MKINPNKSRGARRVRELVPAGTYLVRIDYVEKRLSRVKGSPYLNFTYIVEAGPSKGKRVFDPAYLSDAAQWKLEAICKGAGITDEIDTDDTAGLLNVFCGKLLVISISHEESNYEKDGVEQTGIQIRVNTYRATPETREKLEKLAKQTGATHEPPAELGAPEDAEEEPAEDMPF